MYQKYSELEKNFKTKHMKTIFTLKFTRNLIISYVNQKQKSKYFPLNCHKIS